MRRRLAGVVVGAALLVGAGNAALLAAVAVARRRSVRQPLAVRGIEHVRVVDDHLWRGTAPSDEGYAALAEAGVTTVVDLRPGVVPRSRAGLRVVHLPVTDGQAPSPDIVDGFLRAVADDDGVVFVHCSAGVGRTGALVADHVIRRGVDPLVALRENLAVGPPSVEQIAYALRARTRGVPSQPGLAVTALSRVLDGPRRVYNAVVRGR